MRLVCLECSAVYEAPDSLFGPQPREVRCNRCGYQWTVVASHSEGDTAPAGLSIGSAEPPPPPAQPAELPRPRPAPAPKAEPLAAPPLSSPALPQPRSARVADSLAGPLTPGDTSGAREYPRPITVMEPSAESTRTLLAGAPVGDARLVPPDPEERRLSHELDFDEADRQRRAANGGGGTRRAVVLLILLLVAVGIVAVVLEPQVVAMVPALKPIYAQLGL